MASLRMNRNHSNGVVLSSDDGEDDNDVTYNPKKKRKTKKKSTRTAPRKKRVSKKIEEIDEEKDGNRSGSQTGSQSGSGSGSGSETVSADGMKRNNGYRIGSKPPRTITQPPPLAPIARRRGFFHTAARC